MSKTTSSVGMSGYTGKNKGVRLLAMGEAGSDRGRIKKRSSGDHLSRTSASPGKVKPAKETDPLALYFKQISKFPLLNGRDEQEIGEKIVFFRRQLKELEEI
jgi:RNA polymerase primary sigma factor